MPEKFWKNPHYLTTSRTLGEYFKLLRKTLFFEIFRSEKSKGGTTWVLTQLITTSSVLKVKDLKARFFFIYFWQKKFSFVVLVENCFSPCGTPFVFLDLKISKHSVLLSNLKYSPNVRDVVGKDFSDDGFLEQTFTRHCFSSKNWIFTKNSSLPWERQFLCLKSSNFFIFDFFAKQSRFCWNSDP